MNGPSWSRLTECFAEALELGPARRPGFLRAIADEDPDLARELASLLEAHGALEGDDTGPFLSSIDPDLAAGLLRQAADDPLASGDTIGRYRLLERLGGGGMGVVYRAHDPRLDRTVAVKVLSPWVTADERTLQRFVREARAASSLDHPHIATVHEVDTTPDGRPYIVMACYEGPSLAQRLEDGPLDMDEAQRIATEVAEGLAAAHAAGVVHRDVKPANVVLSPGGARVVDFGIAHADHAPLTRSVLAAGTLPYMSPEQTRGDEAQAPTDVWALGVLLYEMLAGRRPFTARGSALVHQIRNDPPEPLSRLRSDVPPRIARLVERCLAKSPSDRPGSADEVVAVLRGIEPPPAAPSPPRRRALTYGLPASLVVVLAAAAWFLSGAGSPAVADAEPPYALAVLPFEPLDGEAADLYARGIHDDLLTRLSGIAELQVTSRHAVEAFRGSDAPERAARELGVRWLIEGSVGALGDRLRVNLRVVDPETRSQAWARSYLRALTPEDLFTVEEQIVRDLARWLEVSPEGGTRLGAVGPPPDDLEVYRLYIEGRTHLTSRTEAGLLRAEDAFQAALARSPDHAPAWAGLADALSLQASYGYASPADVLPRARDAADRALRIQPDLAEAHASRGLVLEILDYDGPAALDALRRAVELQPSNALAHHWLGALLLSLGRLDEAGTSLRRAAALEPTSPSAHVALARWYQYADSLTTALEIAREARRLEPGLPSVRMIEGEVLREMGRLDEARETLERALELPGVNPAGFPGIWVELGLVHRDLGDTLRARAVLAEMGESLSPFAVAATEAGMGNRDRAFALLESAPVIPEFSHVLRFNPVFDALRGDPRLDVLLQRYDAAWGLGAEPPGDA